MKIFNSKNKLEKVSYFKKLDEGEKLAHVAFFSSSFKKIIEQNNSNKEENKGIYFCLALIEKLKQNDILAISKFNTLLEDEEYNLTKNERMDIYIAVQESYIKLNLFTKAFDCIKEIKLLNKQGVDSPKLSYNIHSRLYYQLKQYNKAILQLKNEIFYVEKKYKEDPLITASANNDLGFYYSLINQHDTAIDYYNKSLNILLKNRKKIPSETIKYSLIQIKENITYSYLKQKKNDLAIIKLKEIDSLYNKQDRLSFILHKIMLATAYLGKKDYSKTNLLIQEIDPIDPSNDILIRLEFLRLKQNYYDKIGNLNLAYENLNLIKKTNDSIFNQKQQKFLKSTELNFVIEENERKTLENNNLIKEKKYTIYSIVIIALTTLLIVSFFLIRLNKKKRIKIEKMNLDIDQKNKQIKSTLKEKEILLKEMNHRVKNNLQIISGILDIQNFSIKDPEVKAVLSEGQNRIQSIALLHKKMYQNKNFNAVNFKEYINELIKHIEQSNFSIDKKIDIAIDIHEIQLEIDYAVPLGLIMNELINNANKHAFKNSKKGNISISLKQIQHNNYSLIFKDNGIGFPENFNINKLDSVGFELISGLTKQINGKLEFFNENGATININFSKN